MAFGVFGSTDHYRSDKVTNFCFGLLLPGKGYRTGTPCHKGVLGALPREILTMEVDLERSEPSFQHLFSR